MAIVNDHYMNKTKFAVLWESFFNEPLDAMCTLLPFLLKKELNASLFQLALFFMVKPAVYIFSLYWSSWINHRKDLLISNVTWAGILARVPFLLFPFVTNAWVLIGLAALYGVFYRGMIPAWIEILKLNIPNECRNKIYSRGAMLGFSLSIILSVIIGFRLTLNSSSWRWLFLIAACIGFGSVWLRLRIPLREKVGNKLVNEQNIRTVFVAPWVNVFNVMRKHPNFCRFQIGIFMCGLSIMIMKPVEPIIFDLLKRSYKELTLAVLAMKSFGYLFTSQLWANLMSKIDIFKITGVIFIFWGLSYFFLLFATLHVFNLFIAYLIYGICLASNHLVWNLSGPIFAKQENSSKFTSVSVALVGVRGLIGPLIGSTLIAYGGHASVLILGITICFFSAYKMFQWEHKKQTVHMSL